jgi:ribonucleoside-diphosphate reductase beta chain
MVLLFNELGNDNNRSVIGGNTTNLINLNNVKYPWAVQIYNLMREQIWIPEKMSIVDDVPAYDTLTPEEKVAFKGMLSYLTYLDSIQTNIVPYFQGVITAPEIKLCMVEQISQEGVHNNSYQYIIQSVIPSDERDEIYNNWRTIPELKERIQNIVGIYQEYIDEPSEFNLLRALFADYILEGIYFMNGFIFFYSLGKRGKMLGCDSIFKLINRDEFNHVRLYTKILQSLFEENEQFRDSIVLENGFNNILKDAVESEIKWSNHILGNRILGINNASTEQYTKYLANKRMVDIGLKPIFEDCINPYIHLQKGEYVEKQNFFESGVTTYLQASSIGDWDW